MAEKRRKFDWLVIAAVVAMVLALPVIYIGGYYSLSWVDEVSIPTNVQIDGSAPPTFVVSECRVRRFRSEWQADIFQPMARVESFISKRTTVASCRPIY